MAEEKQPMKCKKWGKSGQRFKYSFAELNPPNRILSKTDGQVSQISGSGLSF
jgi:hypothetical protein